MSTLSSIIQVNICCFCVFLNGFGCHDHRLHLFHLFIQLNKPYLVLLEEHKSGHSTQKWAAHSACMWIVHLPALHKNMGTHPGSVFSTVCRTVATITGTYKSTGKHPPTWNLSDAVMMHSILIMQKKNLIHSRILHLETKFQRSIREMQRNLTMFVQEGR